MRRCDVYINEVIKSVMAEKQVTKAELARRLEVKPQSVDYLLTRKSVDTDLLYKLAHALDYDFALLYSIRKDEKTALDPTGEPVSVGRARVLVEVSLSPDELIRLNLRQKISDLLDPSKGQP